MDILVDQHPIHSIVFFKRALIMTMVTGTTLTIPTLACIYATWASTNRYDSKLRIWSLLRVAIFALQIPLRWSIWCQLQDAQNARFERLIASRLHEILRRSEWKWTQYFSCSLSMWVFVTLAYTQWVGITTFPLVDVDTQSRVFEGYLGPYCYRLCLLSLTLLVVHLICIYVWLKPIMNHGQPHNDDIVVDDVTGDHLITESDLRSVSSSFGMNDEMLSKCSYCVSFESIQSFLHPKSKFNSMIHLSSTCPICHETYTKDDNVRVVGCRHVFHAECCDKWFCTRNQCPLCRCHVFKINKSSQPHIDFTLPDESEIQKDRAFIQQFEIEASSPREEDSLQSCHPLDPTASSQWKKHHLKMQREYRFKDEMSKLFCEEFDESPDVSEDSDESESMELDVENEIAEENLASSDQEGSNLNAQNSSSRQQRLRRRRRRRRRNPDQPKRRLDVLDVLSSFRF